MGPRFIFRFCDPKKGKICQIYTRNTRTNLPKTFAKKQQILCNKKLLMGPQKGRTSTNYEPMVQVSTFEHTSLLDLFLKIDMSLVLVLNLFSKHSYQPDPGIQGQILAPMR
jgi:hypothetical protein